MISLTSLFPIIARADLTSALWNMVNTIFSTARNIALPLVIIAIIFNIIKIVMGANDKEIDQAKSHIRNLVIVLIILFAMPAIVELLGKLINSGDFAGKIEQITINDAAN